MQKKVGNALYVFDTTPFTITEDTDAEVIYVQQEYLKGYLELNTELESKIKAFNQWLLCVNAPWADEVTPGPDPGPDPGPGPEPTPAYHLLTLSRTRDIYVSGYNNELLPGDYSDEWFNNINNAQIEAGMIDADVYYKIYCNAGAEVFLMSDPSSFESMNGLELIQTTEFGEKYGFVMGDSDMTVNYSYTEKPKYHADFTEDSNAQADVEIDPQDQFAGQNVCIRFLNGQRSSTIAVTSTDVELTYDQSNDEYYFAMPDHNVNIKAVYTQPMYNINFTEDSNATADVQIDPQQTVAGHNVYIRFLTGQSSSTITVTSTDVELTYDQPTDEYYFTMPEHDVNIKAVYTQPIQISINLGDTDLTCDSYEPSGTYYPHAYFDVKVPEGKTADNYTFVTSDDEHIFVSPVPDSFGVEFNVSGSVTFANA